MKVSVIIPTFRRVHDLRRCLEGLLAQQRAAEDLLVITRDTDVETRRLLDSLRDQPNLRRVEVERPGQVYALNAGLAAAKGDIVMITDDDAVPRRDWILRVAAHFEADRTLGGVGGRDVVYEGEITVEGEARTVGRVGWSGRLIGNHHLGAPGQSYVEILKGANMSFRAAAIEGLYFDARLRGAGAQVGNDMAFSFAVMARGWRLLYDPAVLVDHYPAVRLDNDQRGSPDLQAVEDMAFNTWWALACHLPRGAKRYRAMLWEQCVGTRGCPGAIRSWAAALKGAGQERERGLAARRGREAARALLAGGARSL